MPSSLNAIRQISLSKPPLSYLKGFTWKIAGIVGLVSVGSILESVGLTAIIPIIQLASKEEQSAGDGNWMVDFMGSAFTEIGLSLTVTNIVIAMAFLFALKTFVQIVSLYFNEKIPRQLGTKVADILSSRVFETSWEHFTTYEKGFLLNCIFAQTKKLEAMVKFSITELSNVVSIVIYVGFVVVIAPESLIPLTLFLLLFLAIATLFLPRIKSASYRSVDQNTNYVNAFLELLHLTKEVKVANAQSRILEKLYTALWQTKMATMTVAVLTRSLNIAAQSVAAVIILLLIYVAIEFYGYSMAEIILAGALLLRALQRVSAIKGLGAIADGIPPMKVLAKLDEDLSKNAPKKSFVEYAKPEFNSLRFEGVSFSYAGKPDKPVLDKCDFTINAGEIVVILGPSGSGKSTLSELALGLLSPSKGKVTVDGVETDSLSPLSRAKLFGYVPQDVRLLDGTILENVSFFDDSVEMVKVEKALKDAQLLEFVNGLDEGLQHRVSQGGTNFSGGQRQRLALAREFLKGSEVLIMDEPTSALDTSTRESIIDYLLSLRDNMTLIIVTHDQVFRQIADLVLEVKDGGVRVDRITEPRSSGLKRPNPRNELIVDP